MTTDVIPEVANAPLTTTFTDQELGRAIERAGEPFPDRPDGPLPRHSATVRWTSRTKKRMSRWWYRRLRGRIVQRWVHRIGWDAPIASSTFTSTNQAAPLDPLLVETRAPNYGDLYGVDLLTGQPITGSVQELYHSGHLTSPMVVILGAIGTRKSTTAKTFYVLRPATRGVRVAVFDRKAQRDEGRIGGEYGRVADIIPGSTTLVMDRDRTVGTRINILDPAIASTTTDRAVGQDELLRMVATTALQREMSAEEGFALVAAHRAALADANASGRVAVLSDVVNFLYTPNLDAIPGPRTSAGNPILTDRAIVDIERVTEWGLPVALAFERFLMGDLSGIIDGATEGPNGDPVDLDAPLLVIDTSALTEGSASLGLVMAIMSTYLMSKWATTAGYKHLILEEGYAADDLGSVPTVLRALVKRSRGVGATVVGIFHHISDVRPESPLYSLIREAGVVHIFQQDKEDDAVAAVSMFNLPNSMVSIIQTLPPGVNVWKRGRLTPTLVTAFRTPLEAWMTDTDEAMRIQQEETVHAVGS